MIYGQFGLVQASAHWQLLKIIAIYGSGLARMTNTNGSCENFKSRYFFFL